MVLSSTRSKAYQREFSGWLSSLGSNSGTPLYLNPQERVNTILTHFLRLPTPRGTGRRKTTAQRDAAACTRSDAKSVRTDRSSPVADRENLALAKIATVSAAAWDEAS